MLIKPSWKSLWKDLVKSLWKGGGEYEEEEGKALGVGGG